MEDLSVEKIIKDCDDLNDSHKKTILNQINNSICKIITKNSTYKTGIFCIIQFPDNLNLLPVLIVENDLFDNIKDKNKIELSLNKDTTIYEILLDNSRKFVKSEYNLTMIEIKENDGLNIDSFLPIKNYVGIYSKKFYLIYFQKDGV